MILALSILLLILAVRTAVILFQFWFNREHWAHHPSGKKGYLQDLAFGALTLLPLLIGGFIFRLFVFTHTGQPIPQIDYAFLIAGYVGLLVLRKIPPFTTAKQRLRQCAEAHRLTQGKTV